MSLQCNYCGHTEENPTKGSRPPDTNMFKCPHCQRVTFIAARIGSGSNRSQDKLYLSVLPAFYQKWLKSKLRSFYKQHPEIDLELDISQDLMEFGGDQLQLAVRYGEGFWEGVVCEKLFNRGKQGLYAFYLVFREEQAMHPTIQQFKTWIMSQKQYPY